MTIQQIKDDLRDVRCYYSMKTLFDKAIQSVPAPDLIEKVERYNTLIQHAPAKHYIIFVSLYVNGHTQASLADILGYGREYVRDMNNELCEYLQSVIVD